MKNFLTKCFKFILLVLGLYFGASVVLGLLPSNAGWVEASEGIDIYVRTNPTHTDIVLPVRTEIVDWREAFEPLGIPMPSRGRGYVAFGWGEREFWLFTPTWSDLKFTTAAAALFMPTSSLMRATPIGAISDYDSSMHRIRLDVEQYYNLVTFIHESFEMGANGYYVQAQEPRYTGSENFFEAVGKYTLFYTCNSWTNEALKTANVRTATWAPFAQAITYHLK